MNPPLSGGSSRDEADRHRMGKEEEDEEQEARVKGGEGKNIHG